MVELATDYGGDAADLFEHGSLAGDDERLCGGHVPLPWVSWAGLPPSPAAGARGNARFSVMWITRVLWTTRRTKSIQYRLSVRPHQTMHGCAHSIEKTIAAEKLRKIKWKEVNLPHREE
ncbi:hypothetical protein GCM10027360_42040 [Amycolatopsis echigonensis]